MNINFERAGTIAEIIVAAFIVLANGLVFVAFCIEKGLRRRIYYYVLALAVIDFLAGLLAIPLTILLGTNLLHEHSLCLAALTTILIVLSISKWTLVCIACNCYWALVHPLHYHCNKDKVPIAVIVGVGWIMGVIIGILPAAGWRLKNDGCTYYTINTMSYVIFYYIADTLTPSVILLVLYAMIVRNIFRMRKLTNQSSIDRATQALTINEDASRKFLSLIVVFIICWGPIYIIDLVQFIAPDFKIPQRIVQILLLLAHIGVALNPILYSYRLKDVRKAILKIFRRSKRENLAYQPNV